jgi:hypothetical protein
MRQSTDAGLGVIEHDGDTAPKAHCDQNVLGRTDPKIGNPNYQFPSAHAALR